MLTLSHSILQLKLLNLKLPNDYFFTCSDFPSPITLLIGDKTEKNIQEAARLTVRYSDACDNDKKIVVEYGSNKLDNKICVLNP